MSTLSSHHPHRSLKFLPQRVLTSTRTLQRSRVACMRILSCPRGSRTIVRTSTLSVLYSCPPNPNTALPSLKLPSTSDECSNGYSNYSWPSFITLERCWWTVYRHFRPPSLSFHPDDLKLAGNIGVGSYLDRAPSNLRPSLPVAHRPFFAPSAKHNASKRPLISLNDNESCRSSVWHMG